MQETGTIARKGALPVDFEAGLQVLKEVLNEVLNEVSKEAPVTQSAARFLLLILVALGRANLVLPLDCFIPNAAHAFVLSVERGCARSVHARKYKLSSWTALLTGSEHICWRTF